MRIEPAGSAAGDADARRSRGKSITLQLSTALQSPAHVPTLALPIGVRGQRSDYQDCAICIR
jgi:hypothetical protein